MFAAIYCILNFCKVTKSNHGFFRVLAIYIFFAYYVLYVVFTLVMVGTFYATIRVFLSTYPILGDECDDYSYVSIIDELYLMGHLFLIIVSSTMFIMDAEWFYKFFVNLFGIYMVGTVILTIYTFVNERESKPVFYALIFGIGVLLAIVIVVVINCRRVSLTKYTFGIITIVYLVPTYMIVMLIYAVCNISDISWGTRPDMSEITYLTKFQRRIDEKYRAYRTKVLIYWIILNLLISRGIIIYAQG